MNRKPSSREHAAARVVPSGGALSLPVLTTRISDEPQSAASTFLRPGRGDPRVADGTSLVPFPEMTVRGCQEAVAPLVDPLRPGTEAASRISPLRNRERLRPNFILHPPSAIGLVAGVADEDA